MMRKTRSYTLLLILTIAFSFSVADGCWGGDRAFRQTNWGMHTNDVLAAEAKKPTRQNTTLLEYKTTVAEKKVILSYILAKDRLVGAKYRLAENHIIDRKYVRDYDDFKAILSRKYGPPKEEKDTWKNGDFFRNDPDQWGMAVSTGKLTRRASWQTDDTDIVLDLKGGDFKIHCEVAYWSRKLKHLVQQAAPTDAPLSTDRTKERITNTKIEKSLDNF
jgi:hypothetical protein